MQPVLDLQEWVLEGLGAPGFPISTEQILHICNISADTIGKPKCKTAHITLLLPPIGHFLLLDLYGVAMIELLELD